MASSSHLPRRVPSKRGDANWNAGRKDNQTSSRGLNRDDSIGDLASLAVPSRRDSLMGSFRPRETILHAVSSVKDTVKTLDEFLGRSMSSQFHGMTGDDDDSMTHELRRLAKNEAALRNDLDGLYVDLNEEMAGESWDLSEKEAVLRNDLEKASLEEAFSYDAEENISGMLHPINHVQRDRGDLDETAPGLCRVSPASLFSSDVRSRERDSYSTFATGPVDLPPPTAKTGKTVPVTAGKRPSQVFIKKQSNSFYGLRRQISENGFRSLQDTLDRAFSGDIEEEREKAGTALPGKSELVSENHSLQMQRATLGSDVRDEALSMDSVMPVPGQGTAGSCAGTNTSKTEQVHDFTVMNPDLTKMDTQAQLPKDRCLIFGLASLVFGRHEYQTGSLLSLLPCMKSETDPQNNRYARTYEGGLCVWIATSIAVKNVHNSNALLPHVSDLVVMTVIAPITTWIQSKLPHRMEETTLGLFIIVGQALVCHVFLPAFESETARRGSEVIDSPY